MQKTLAILVLPVVVLLALAGCTPGDNLRIDDPTPGSITDPDFVDLYRFTASANDRLRVRVLRTSGVSNPRVFVRNSAGTQVCEGSSAGPLTEIPSCGPLAPGTHTFLVDDAGHDDPSEYILYIQRLARGTSSGALSDGEVRSSSLPERLDSEVFTWSAADDDLVRLRVRTGNIFRPRVTVTNGNGAAVCGGAGTAGFAEFTCRLVGGQHWVVVDEERGSDGFGGTPIAYQLHLRRLRNPAGATAIAYGQTRSGSIDDRLETDAYAFTAANGDRVRLTLQRGQFQSLASRVTVHNPIGTQVCVSSTTGTALQFDCPQPLVAGPHWIIVDDDDGLGAGTYDLTLTRL